MNTFVFAHHHRFKKHDSRVLFKGPAKSGDLYEAMLSGAETLIVIDEAHDQLGPTYSEYLYLLNKGLPLYGLGFVGALRASELSSFGMIGIGENYTKLKKNQSRNLSEVLDFSKESNYCLLQDLPLQEWNFKPNATLPPCSKHNYFLSPQPISEGTTCDHELQSAIKRIASQPPVVLSDSVYSEPFAFRIRLNYQFGFSRKSQPQTQTELLDFIFSRIGLYLWLSQELLSKTTEEVLEATSPEKAKAFKSAFLSAHPYYFENLGPDFAVLLDLIGILLSSLLEAPEIIKRITQAYTLKNCPSSSKKNDLRALDASKVLVLEDSLWIYEQLLSSHRHLDVQWRLLAKKLALSFLSSEPPNARHEILPPSMQI